MDEPTIHNLLKRVRNFVGTFPRDLMPNKIDYNYGLIVNTDPHYKQGQHWVAIYKDDYGNCEYFDPYGMPPYINEFIEFLSNNCENIINWSGRQLQCIDCITCGYYCVEYMKYRCNGYSLCDVYNSFTNNPYINDIIVRERINKKPF